METLIAGRIGFDTLGSQYPAANHISVENISIAGIPCRWFRPEQAPEHDVVVYIHGGGFIYGSFISHTPMVSHIAAALNRNILMIDYALAPEQPFPAGLDDCVSVITTFSKAHPEIRFGMIGDSAGGNLTITTQLKLKAMGSPMPQYSIVISPWTDLACNNESYHRNQFTDHILNCDYLRWCADLYAGGDHLKNPLISPVHADLRGLPPALILCGTAEILLDDSILLHERFLTAGVAAELILFENEQHVWPFMDIATPASVKALSDFRAFVQQHSASCLL